MSAARTPCYAGRQSRNPPRPLSGLESRKSVEAEPPRDAAESRQDTEFGGDLLACETLRRKASIAAAVAGAGWLRKERGRNERSCKSPTPSAGIIRPT